MNEEQNSNHSEHSNLNKNNFGVHDDGLKTYQNLQNNSLTPHNQSEVNSNKIFSQQNTRVHANFTVQAGGLQQNQAAFSQHSKVTSIIRRRTNNYDDDEDFNQLKIVDFYLFLNFKNQICKKIKLRRDFGMVDNYSQSSHTYIALNDKGEIRKKGESIVQNDQQNINSDGQQQFLEKADSTIDMNFLHDINNEVNYLITKFNDDNHRDNKLVAQGKDSQIRMKSGDLSKRPAITQILENDRQDSSQLMPGERSTKTVAASQVQTQSAKKIIPPLSGKNNQISGRQLNQKQFMTKEDHQTYSNVQTLNHQYNSGVMSNSDYSERLKTADYVTKTYERGHSAMPQIQQKLNQDSQSQNETISLAVLNQDKRVYEDASIRFVSSNNQHEDNQSKYSLSDNNSQVPFRNKSAIISQEEIQQKQLLIASNNNRLTFRNESGQIETRNEYQLPNDDSAQKELPQFMQIQEPTAQFDMQNFQALDRKIDANSVDSSKDFTSSKLQEMISQQTPYSQNQQMFGTTQKMGGHQIYSDQDDSLQNTQNNLSHREKRYLNDQTQPNQNLINNDDENQDDQHQYEDEDYEDDDNEDYQDDNNMPFSDNDNNEQQTQLNVVLGSTQPYKDHSYSNIQYQNQAQINNHKQSQNQGELLFTNNQHIFKQRDESDNENDHQMFLQQNSNKKSNLHSKQNLPFQLPQDDDEDEEDNNNLGDIFMLKGIHLLYKNFLIYIISICQNPQRPISKNSHQIQSPKT